MVAATLVGLLTGFLGVGGGFVLVPALVLVLGFTMPVAVGTSLLVIAINSATALVARAQQGVGDLDWPLILGFAAVAVVGSLIGAAIMTALHESHGAYLTLFGLSSVLRLATLGLLLIPAKKAAA